MLLSLASIVLCGLLKPTDGQAPTPGNFSSSCGSIHLNSADFSRTAVLTADCRRRDGSIHSGASINLNDYITDDNGNLRYVGTGGDFSLSCGNIHLDSAGFSQTAVLTANCRRRDGGIHSGASINLNDHITNDNGNLRYVGLGLPLLSPGQLKEPRCTIKVKFWQLSPAYYHAYIVTSDAQGTTRFRAGPAAGGPSSGPSGAISSGSGGSSSRSSGSGSSSPNSSNSSSPGSGGNGGNTGPWGPLTAQCDNVAGSIPTAGCRNGSYGPGALDWDPGNPPSMTVVNGGLSCSVYNQRLANAVSRVNRAKIPYNPLSTNSNAFVNNALTWSGITPGKPPVWVPGWDTTLP